MGLTVDPSALTEPISGTVTAKVQDSSGATITVGQKTMVSSFPIVIASDQSTLAASLGNSTGKTNILKTGTLVTTATTADQVVLTYTVTSGKTFYITYLEIMGRLTVLSATATILGTISLETPSGTKCITETMISPTTAQLQINRHSFSEPIPVAAAAVARVVCTPAATTSMTWVANFGGYEK